MACVNGLLCQLLHLIVVVGILVIYHQMILSEGDSSYVLSNRAARNVGSHLHPRTGKLVVSWLVGHNCLFSLCLHKH